MSIQQPKHATAAAARVEMRINEAAEGWTPVQLVRAASDCDAAAEALHKLGDKLRHRAAEGS